MVDKLCESPPSRRALYAKRHPHDDQNPSKILLTGAAGGLGTALRDRLKANCDVLRLSDKTDFGPRARVKK